MEQMGLTEEEGYTGEYDDEYEDDGVYDEAWDENDDSPDTEKTDEEQDPDAEDAIVLSPGVTPVYISRKPYDPGDIIPGTNGYIPVVKDEIGNLVSALPDEIVISGIKVQTVQEMMDMELDGSREKFLSGGRLRRNA